ncbi:MAG: hypothetical protein ACRC57_00485 [Sarcina sp.]
MFKNLFRKPLLSDSPEIQEKAKILKTQMIEEAKKKSLSKGAFTNNVACKDGRY